MLICHHCRNILDPTYAKWAEAPEWENSSCPYHMGCVGKPRTWKSPTKTQLFFGQLNHVFWTEPGIFALVVNIIFFGTIFLICLVLSYLGVF